MLFGLLPCVVVYKYAFRPAVAELHPFPSLFSPLLLHSVARRDRRIFALRLLLLLFLWFFVSIFLEPPYLQVIEMGRQAPWLLVFLAFKLLMPGVLSTTFTIVNKCDYTVWPGILSNAGVPQLSITGFELQTGDSKIITAPTSWGGRFWGRTYCSQDDSGKFSCVTGDCGSNKVECAGNGAAPPATLAEFTLNGAGGLDFFDVSLVDGYNLPMIVVPQGGTGEKCTSTGCVVDLNSSCPTELKVTSVDGSESVACKSACEAFGKPEYCCNGAYSTPGTCQPSSYSEMFKNACPRAYSYAYDDSTSTFTCASADYIITFCPSPTTSQKSSQGPATNGTMEYEGAELDQSGASPVGLFSGANSFVGVLSFALAIHLFSSLSLTSFHS